MVRGHYWLQYLIYVVAVHRWLRRRLAGYDYETHFGGVRYLFLRGMDPARGAASGVYADRPSRAVIERLDALLGGAS
jgi:exodeoxyribonuclease V beta subunit